MGSVLEAGLVHGSRSGVCCRMRWHRREQALHGCSSTPFSPSSLTSTHLFCPDILSERNYVWTNGFIDQKMASVRTLSETL